MAYLLYTLFFTSNIWNTMSSLHEKAQLSTFAFYYFFLVQLALLSCLSDQLMAMNLLRIGTGGETGVYYPIGRLIAQGITNQGQDPGSPLGGIIGVPQNSAGSISNVLAIANKEVEAGLVQADIAAFALAGEMFFSSTKDTSSIRAIASLYPEKFQIVVRKEANIDSFEKLKDKRISIDEEGSGTLAVMRIILAAYGMKEDEMQPLYLKPVFTQNKIINHQLDGFVMMAGAPMAAVTKLNKEGITLVPIDKRVVAKVSQQYPYLFPGKIEESVYEGIPETTTLEVYALLAVHKDMPEETAYAITESLFSQETTSLLQKGHAQGSSVTLDTALNGISIPLHPGADRFYHEHNVN